MNPTFNSLTCGPVDLTSLASLSGPQLASLYTELTQKSIEKFRDKATGVARITPILEARLVEIAAPVEEKPAVIERKAKGRKRFNYPPREKQANHRPGTKRAALIEILSRPEGATFLECQEVTGWVGEEKYKITFENIYLLHVYLGYGLEEGEDGRIRLTLRGEKGSHVEVVESGAGIPVSQLRGRRSSDKEGRGDGEDAFPGDRGGADCHPASDLEGARFGGGSDRAKRVPADSGKEKHRKVSSVTVELSCLDRLSFLMKAGRHDSPEEVVIAAVNFYDRAISAVLDQGVVKIHHKNGTREDLSPCCGLLST